MKILNDREKNNFFSRRTEAPDLEELSKNIKLVEKE